MKTLEQLRKEEHELMEKNFGKYDPELCSRIADLSQAIVIMQGGYCAKSLRQHWGEDRYIDFCMKMEIPAI